MTFTTSWGCKKDLISEGKVPPFAQLGAAVVCESGPNFSAPQDLVLGSGTQHMITVCLEACVAGFTFAAVNSR